MEQQQHARIMAQQPRPPSQTRTASQQAYNSHEPPYRQTKHTCLATLARSPSTSRSASSNDASVMAASDRRACSVDACSSTTTLVAASSTRVACDNQRSRDQPGNCVYDRFWWIRPMGGMIVIVCLVCGRRVVDLTSPDRDSHAVRSTGRSNTAMPMTTSCKNNHQHNSHHLSSLRS